jgi:hypothetical protein
MVYPDSDFDLSKRITQQLRQGNIESQILEIIQQGFDKILDKEHILLSRPEKACLFRQSIKVILTDMLADIESDKS